MFVRQCYLNKNGRRHAYWALVESYRTDRGPRQRTVAYLGQLDEAGRVGVKRAAKGKGGHGYWYQNPWVSSDVLLMIKYDLGPAERGLVRGADGAVWVFPEDYPERLRAIASRLPAR